MSEKPRVQPNDLEYRQPASSEEVDLLWPDLLKVAEGLPNAISPDFQDWLKENPLALILAYLDGEPVFMVHRFLYDASDIVELHGGIRPGYEKQGIEHAVSVFIMDDCFFTQDKQEIVLAVPHGNRGARGFALRWGFHREEHREEFDVYRLTREQYQVRRARLESDKPDP